MQYGKILLLLFALACSSCSKELTEDELESYLADPSNGLTQMQEVNDLTIEVAYRPTSLLLSDQINPNKSSLPQYYLLVISRKGQEILDPTRGFSTYSSLLQTLAFRPQEYIRLTTARGDTLLPSNAILERTYGMGSSTRLLVTFPVKNDKQDVLFHLGEFGLHTGNVFFSFRAEDINAVPKLKASAQANLNP